MATIKLLSAVHYTMVRVEVRNGYSSRGVDHLHIFHALHSLAFGNGVHEALCKIIGNKHELLRKKLVLMDNR